MNSLKKTKHIIDKEKIQITFRAQAKYKLKFYDAFKPTLIVVDLIYIFHLLLQSMQLRKYLLGKVLKYYRLVHFYPLHFL